MIELPTGMVPMRDLTTTEILYGARSTTFRYELLAHDPSTGVDSLIGFLDGVQPAGSLNWSASASVKKSGTLTVLDVASAAQGLIRIADVNLVTTRIRPVLIIEGLPEIPLSIYEITAAPESWADTGRSFALELHDKSTVLYQDEVDETYTADTTFPVLTIISSVIQSAGELISVDASETSTLLTPKVWPAGTSKLQIVNDLLGVLNYNALWVDGVGNFRATPYVKPADRSILYVVLNDDTGEAIVRELTDGAESIYTPDWSRDRDVYGIPNKVVAVQSGTGDTEPLSDFATNEDPTSPFSYQARGRWIVSTITGVEVPDYSADPDPVASTKAFLKVKAQQSLIASSAVQATVSVKCLPIPLELLDAIMFASAPADIDARHTVQSVQLPLQFDALMSLNLQEVIDL
jgi:hypothetical protein